MNCNQHDKAQLFAKFKNSAEGVQSHLKFSKTLQKIAPYHADYNSIIKKLGSPSSFLSYKHLKLKLRVFLAGYSVAMVTYCVIKTIPTCSPMIGQFFDTMLVASIDKVQL